MKSRIRYVPDDVIIDLAAPDLSHPDAYDIISRHYRMGNRADRRFNRANPAFVCLKHEDGSNSGLYIKKIKGEWWAVHYEAAGCQSIRLPGPMSDEHKRQAEYWARAAIDAGYRAELEQMLTTGTRPDVLIYGPVRTGIEVQRSPMTASNAVRRTSKAALAGVTDIWFTTRTMTAPTWAWRVPTVLSRELDIPGEGQSWDITPPRRSVQAAGLRVVRIARCAPEHFSQCPNGRNHCGKQHPKPQPWPGLSVDDVAAMFPAGQIVPLRFWGIRMPGSRHREAVFLVSPESASLYAEVTGRTSAPSFRSEAEDKPPGIPAPRTACQNQQPDSDNSIPRMASALQILPPRSGVPTARCRVCWLPIDPVLAAAGEETHATCDPDGLAARWPANRTGACVMCHGLIEIGQPIRLVPGSGEPSCACFGHDHCVISAAS